MRLMPGIVWALGYLIALFILPASAVQAQATAQEALIDARLADAKSAMLTNPDEALRRSRAAEQTLASSPRSDANTIRLATALWLQGEAILRLRKPSDAKPLIERALAILQRAPNAKKLHGDLLASQGGIRSDDGQVTEALVAYQSAYRIYREIGDRRGQAKALMLIASLYSNGNDNAGALRYYRQALDTYPSDRNISYSLHNNIGNTLAELRQLYPAINEFNAAMVFARQEDSSLLEATVLANIAHASLLARDYKRAESAIEAGLKLSSLGEAKSTRPHLLALAAQEAYQTGHISLAKSFAEQAFAEAGEDGASPDYRDAHDTAYKIYRKLGDDRLALTHLEALKRIDDDATRVATSTNTALMAARFDFANQELRITRLKAIDLQRRIANEREQAHMQRIIFYGAAGATVLVIGLLGFSLVTVRRSRNEVRAANIDLAATNTALAKALAAKTEFLATTSHEIRTPLNGILGMTQVMLADRLLMPAMRERVSVVHSAGETMKALVDDILDVAKIETGNMTVEHAPVEMCAVLRDASQLWQQQARAKGLDFTLDLDGCPARVLGDAARLRQIVFNLLGNASKFTQAGGITLSVGTAENEQGAQRVRVAVSDTGIGIAADKLDCIFESFRQVDAGTTRQFGGTGLGLAICRNLARAMGGDVSVTSVVGEGSTFTLDLPLIAADVDEAPAAGAADAGGLLLVDRNPIQRSRMRALLEPHAGQVGFAGDVEEALAVIATGRWSQMLVDDTTLKSDERGVEAASLLVATAHATGVSVAILWPANDAATLAQLGEIGADQVLPKPLAASAMIAMLYPKDAINRSSESDPALVSKAA